MKKLLVLLLLAAVSFSPLFAQSRQRTRVYIATITGSGGGPNDAAYFSRAFASEIAAYGYTLAGARSTADFTVSGTIYPHLNPDGGRVLYTLSAKLVNRLGATVVEQEMFYENAEDSGESLLILVFQMFANIYAIDRNYSEDWRDKWAFFGAWVFWSPRFYQGSDRFFHPANAGAGVSMEVNVLPFAAFESGLDFSMDILPEGGEGSRSVLLGVPLLCKLVLKPGEYPLIEPYGGVVLNIASNGGIEPPLFSWAAGLQLGAKAGAAGAVFFECRAMGDIGSIDNPQVAGGSAERMVVKVGFGYKFGAGKKY